MAVGLCIASVEAEPPQVWPVDPLLKVFADAEFGGTTSRPHNDSAPAGEALTMPAVTIDPIDVARGEHASFQFAVRDDRPITGLRAVAGAMEYKDGSGDSLKPQSVRWVGFVPVDRPMQTPCKDRLRVPPAEFPDPLLEAESIDVPAGRTQPVWITVPIPKNAKPGVYVGTLTIKGRMDGGDFEIPHTYALRVHDVTIDHTRLWVTNWSNICWNVPPGMDDTAYWSKLRHHARMMADHLQNTFILSPLQMCRYSVAADGALAFDWSAFDRAVQIFIDEGVIGRIEGAHLGGRGGDWKSPFVANIRRVKDGKIENAAVAPTDPEAEKFLSKFLPALVAHLKEKGWLDKYMQHIADEPTDDNFASYDAILAIVRRVAPEIRVIDAIHTSKLIGRIDVAVPMLNYLHKEYAAYKEHPRDGRELWFYTCCEPQGEYANRFIEQPLIKTRLLHWINFEYNLTGYLHWGYNWYYPGDPFKNTTASAPASYWPAGDAYIVYPGPEGKPLSCIRFEAMRDGIVDHELLSMLADRDPAAARRIAAKHVLAFDKYDTDVATFRASRRELLGLLEQH
jgi:hypothetical protein